MAAEPLNSNVEIPEERRFVWRNLEAYLTNQLNEQDRARVESFLCECPYTKEYVETEKQFADAVRRCVEEPNVECPQGLREKVLAALDNCEMEDEEEDSKGAAGSAPGSVVRFPWMGAVFLVAASVMLVVALVLTFGGDTETLPQTLAPMVSRVSLEVPQTEDCRYSEARKAYQEVFQNGPELPSQFGSKKVKVCHFVCEEVDGNPVMCTVYDCPDGERFGLMIFQCKCLDHLTTEEMMSMEVMVEGKTVLLWRDGDYYRALVGRDSARLRRHMEELRGVA